MSSTAETATEIRPFHAEIPQEEIDDLRRRLATTRWPDKETDQSQGGRLCLDRATSATGELTRDEVLDNITLYWLTNTGVPASRLYWEYKGGFFNAKGVAIPVAVSVFPGEQYQAPRSWTERAYPQLIYYNQVDRGHFAAWEQPKLFSSEVRAVFRSLR